VEIIELDGRKKRWRQIVYGIKALPTGDPFIEAAEKAMEALSFAENPGTFLVDLLPFCESVLLWIIREYSFVSSKVCTGMDAGGRFSKEGSCMERRSHGNGGSTVQSCEGSPREYMCFPACMT
jgi:hypothetical protein